MKSKKRLTKKNNKKLLKNNRKNKSLRLRGGNPTIRDIMDRGKTKEWTNTDIMFIILSGQRIELMERAERLLKSEESSLLLPQNLEILQAIVKMRDVHLFFTTRKNNSDMYYLDALLIFRDLENKDLKNKKLKRFLFTKSEQFNNQNITDFSGIVRTFFIIASAYISICKKLSENRHTFMLDTNLRTKYDSHILAILYNFFAADKSFKSDYQKTDTIGRLTRLENILDNEDLVYEILKETLELYTYSKINPLPANPSALPPLPNVDIIHQSLSPSVGVYHTHSPSGIYHTLSQSKGKNSKQESIYNIVRRTH